MCSYQSQQQLVFFNESRTYYFSTCTLYQFYLLFSSSSIVKVRQQVLLSGRRTYYAVHTVVVFTIYYTVVVVVIVVQVSNIYSSMKGGHTMQYTYISVTGPRIEFTIHTIHYYSTLPFSCTLISYLSVSADNFVFKMGEGCQKSIITNGNLEG